MTRAIDRITMANTVTKSLVLAARHTGAISGIHSQEIGERATGALIPGSAKRNSNIHITSIFVTVTNISMNKSNQHYPRAYDNSL